MFKFSRIIRGELRSSISCWRVNVEEVGVRNIWLSGFLRSASRAGWVGRALGGGDLRDGVIGCLALNELDRREVSRVVFTSFAGERSRMVCGKMRTGGDMRRATDRR